jgi:cytochrome c-type biogenesis protein CcmH
VGSHLICYCGCPRQTIADCQCGVADDVKKQIWTSLQAGQSLDAIVEAFVVEHGEQFRSMPRGRGLGILAWTVPWAAMLAAGAAVMFVVSRWSRKGRKEDDAPAPPPSTTATPEDPYAKRLQEELDQLD